MVKGSDNYFVLITRESLYNLPYSVDEIYGLTSSGKYQHAEKTYQEMYQIYSARQTVDLPIEILLTEDSNSGFQFSMAWRKKQDVLVLVHRGNPMYLQSSNL